MFRARQGSALDRSPEAGGSPASLRALLPASLPIQVAMRMDVGGLMAWVKPMIDGMLQDMPEDKRASFARLMDESMKLSAYLGPNFAAAVGFDEGGMQVVEVVDVKDGAAYLEKFEQLFDGDVLSGLEGLEMKKREVTKIAGVDVHAFDMRFDMPKLMAAQGQAGAMPPEVEARMTDTMKRLLGGDAMTVRMATVGDRMLYVMGAESHMVALIEAVRSASPTRVQMTDVTGTGGVVPTMTIRVELREMLRQVLGIAGDLADQAMPKVPAGAPVPLAVWAGRDGRDYAGGLSLDVEGLAGLVRALTDGGGR
jgi:hypothetical protein